MNWFRRLVEGFRRFATSTIEGGAAATSELAESLPDELPELPGRKHARPKRAHAPKVTRRRALEAENHRLREELALERERRQRELAAERRRGVLQERERQKRREETRRLREARAEERRGAPRPSDRRYPYLVRTDPRGTRRVVHPNWLRAVYSSEKMAVDKFLELYHAGVSNRVMAVWAVSPTRYELYVGDSR